MVDLLTSWTREEQKFEEIAKATSTIVGALLAMHERREEDGHAMIEG
jgi:hypothetical protein